MERAKRSPEWPLGRSLGEHAPVHDDGEAGQDGHESEQEGQGGRAGSSGGELHLHEEREGAEERTPGRRRVVRRADRRTCWQQDRAVLGERRGG